MEIARLHVKSRFVLSARGGDVGRQAAEQPVEADETLGQHVDDDAVALYRPLHTHHHRLQHDRRKRSNVFGQTIRLAFPVSSSSVMKMTPLALPGRCRVTTTPPP